jgi:hypothetical protein
VKNLKLKTFQILKVPLKPDKVQESIKQQTTVKERWSRNQEKSLSRVP